MEKKSKKITIHSAPRSGSTWLGAIFDSHPAVAFRFQPLFSYAFKDYLGANASQEKIANFFKEIKKTENAFILQIKKKKKGISPNFIKEEGENYICYKEVRYHHILKNLMSKDQEVIVVGLVRSPMATINSWLNAPKEFKKGLEWEVEEEWRYAPSKNLNKPEEFNGFEKWKEVTQLFLELQKNYPDRFYLQQYEKLIVNPLEETEKLFNFCDLQMNEQTEFFLKKSTHSHQEDAYSVFKRKLKDDSWKKSLPVFIQEEILSDPQVIQWNKQFNWF